MNLEDFKRSMPFGWPFDRDTVEALPDGSFQVRHVSGKVLVNVVVDEYGYPRPVPPPVVLDAIRASFKDAETLIANTRWDHIGACWFFWHRGIFCGIDLMPDGSAYIHE